MNEVIGNSRQTLKRFFGTDTAVLLTLFVLAALVMTLLSPDKFLTARSLTSMGFQFPELGLLALAITLSLITGGIDLSVVSVANLAGILAAMALTRLLPQEATAGRTVWICCMAISIGLGTGLVCGMINGLLITRLGITPILATLGTMQLFAGLAMVITRGPAISGYPDAFLVIGNGTVGGIPIPLLYFIAAALCVAWLLGRTVLGVRIYLVGSNETAARFAGIPVRAVLLRTYAVSGLLAGATGILMIARTNSAKADYGASYLLQAVLVAVLGGIDPRGGSGKIRGVVLALLTLQILSTGFSLLRLSQFTKEFAWGALLVGVIAIKALQRSRGQRPESPELAGQCR